MENKVTLKELSKILNVSISTVSKALNDSPEISVQTRNRVKELAKLNHYLPNAMAQNLKTKFTKTVGVVIPAIMPHFFAKALLGIEKKASELGYRVVICISNESTKKEADSINTLITGQVDGLIMSLSRETQTKNTLEHLKLISHYKIPLVLFDRVVADIDCDKIHIDDSLQAEKATMDLYKSGARNIAYFSAIAHTSVDEERKIGYLQATKNLKMKSRIIDFEYSNFPETKFEKLMRDDKIDGILASDELGAILVMKTALKKGFKIPEELSVIGFTNGLMGEHFLPSLSTVDQHAEEQGRLALELVVDRIEGKVECDPIEYKLETSFIHRNSTR